MIGRLKGRVDSVTEANAIIDVNGVGYEVQCSTRFLASLETGSDVALAVETYVREDAIRLFGFASEVERGWFRALQTVQGVGSKVALAVLGTLDPSGLSEAIALGNWAALAEAPGVGKKLAQRMIAELKDKPMPFAASDLGQNALVGRAIYGARADCRAAEEAVSALTNLGYQANQASGAIAAALRELGSDAETPALIRRGLRELAVS